MNIRAALLLLVRFSAAAVGLLAVFGSCVRLLIGTQRPCPVQLSVKNKKNAEDAVEKGPCGGGCKEEKKSDNEPKQLAGKSIGQAINLFVTPVTQ